MSDTIHDQRGASGFSELARENVLSLINRSKDHLKAELFDEKTQRIIKDRRLIADLETLSSDLKEGVLGHNRAVPYLKAVRRLTTPLDTVPQDLA